MTQGERMAVVKSLAEVVGSLGFEYHSQVTECLDALRRETEYRVGVESTLEHCPNEGKAMPAYPNRCPVCGIVVINKLGWTHP
jgi:hypothetical protein